MSKKESDLYRANQTVIVLVALYKYINYPIRILHPLLEEIPGIKPYTIFFKDCDTNSFSPPTKKEVELFVRLISKLNPRIVGFSVLSPFAPIATELTRIIKKGAHSPLVMWGGIHPTISPESCINEVDMLCMGEGEGALEETAKHLRDSRPYDNIKNLWVRNGSQTIKNPMRPLIQDLDSLPFPSYGNDSYYFIDSNRVTKNESKLRLDVQTSRGCPYYCSFCINSLLRPLFKDLGPYIRRRSVSNIINEIKEYLTVYGKITDYIVFINDSFVTDDAWLEEFAASYKEQVGLPFFVRYNPQKINSAILCKLAKAGAVIMNIGIQTGSDFIRNNIFDRPGKNEVILNLVQEISNHNIKIMYDFIMNNPYETENSLKETIALLLHLPKPLICNLYSMQYFPNYPLTERALKDRFIKPALLTTDVLMEATGGNWNFFPSLLPYTKKQMLQNIIWLISVNCVKDNIVKYAVFGNSAGSKFCLIFLNFKSIILGKVTGPASFLWRKSRWIWYSLEGLKHILSGDYNLLYSGIKRHTRNLKYKINVYKKKLAAPVSEKGGSQSKKSKFGVGDGI